MIQIELDRLAGLLRLALRLPERPTPFPRQRKLLRGFIAGRMPTALDVLTGLGKPAKMAIRLVARTARPSQPRRLVYVVDQRAVVDQTAWMAEQLRNVVAADPQLKRSLGVRDELAISTLREKHLDNRQWLFDPVAPALVIDTVDMIGPRLLFERYGLSRKMRPYHAGLLDADSLLVLDEAHLVQPFEGLIEALSAGRDAIVRSLGAEPDFAQVVLRLRFLSLSATGQTRGGSLMLSDPDRMTLASEVCRRKRVDGGRLVQ